MSEISFLEETENYTEEKEQHVLASMRTDLHVASGTLCSLILTDLQGHQKEYCSEDLLKRHFPPNNRKRDLYMAIISLRNRGYNIAHIRDKGFALLDGTREVRQDSYKMALWSALHRDKDLFKKSDVFVALGLSDACYHAQYLDICAIKDLWQLIFTKNHLSDGLLRKKKAWDVIVQDFDVYEKNYYTQHPLVKTEFSPSEIKVLKKMFEFYKEYVELEDPQYSQIKERLYHYLMIYPYGVTLQDIQDFLKSDIDEEINAWMGIRILVRGGYGPQIYYLDGRFFLRDPSEKPNVVEPELIDNVCELFKENPVCEHITLALYKRGFCAVNPFDVRNILDILMKAERLVPCCDNAEKCEAHGGIFAGPGHDGSYLQELIGNQTLWKIKESWPYDIMRCLKVHVYPKYFGWSSCGSVPLEKRRKKNKRDSDVTMGETKKPCLEEEVLAPKEELQQDQKEVSMLEPEEHFAFDLSNLSKESQDKLFDFSCSFLGGESSGPHDGITQTHNDSTLPSDFNIEHYFLRTPINLEQASTPDLDDGTGVSSSGRCGDLEADSDGACATRSPPINLEQDLNPDLDDGTGVSSSGRCSDSEADSDGAGDTESVKACAQKRQKLLLEHLTQKENEFCSAEELQALYGEQGTKETVLEDAVSLIHSKHNIEYKREREQYRLRPGPWPVQPPQDSTKNPYKFFCLSLRKESFLELNIGEKTYHLYEHGYQSVPLSTVALLCKIRRRPTSRCLSKREKRLVALKDKILEDERIEVAGEYTGCFPGCGTVRYDDLSCVRKSMDLYTDGRAILAKNKTKKVCARRKNRQYDRLTSYPEVMDFMKKNKGKTVTEDHLKQVVNATIGHHRREAICAIGDLRACGMNIDHNVQEGGAPIHTFTLCDGSRETKPGCFKKVLWRMLDGQSLSSASVKRLFLALSDLGYNPGWSVVARVLMLKKLCLRDSTVDSQKLDAWDIIMREGALRHASYYAKYSDGAVCLNAACMRELTYCWGVYNNIFYHYDSLVSQRTKEVLEKSKAEGLSFPNFKKALLASLPKNRVEKTNEWCALSDLMRRGYAGQIDLIGERVVWCPDAPNIEQTNNTLLPDFCNIPHGYEYGPAAVFLHKRGHLNVGPWDVAQLLDIFAFLGCREENRHHSLQALWSNIGSGCEQLHNLSQREAVFVKRIKWLKGMDALEGIQNGFVSLEKILNEAEWFLEEEKGALLEKTFF